jgi:hypothetical protein
MDSQWQRGSTNVAIFSVSATKTSAGPAAHERGGLELGRSGFNSTLKGAMVAVTFILVLLVVYFLLLSTFWFVGIGILFVAVALLVVKRRINYYGKA